MALSEANTISYEDFQKALKDVELRLTDLMVDGTITTGVDGQVVRHLDRARACVKELIRDLCDHEETWPSRAGSDDRSNGTTRCRFCNASVPADLEATT